MHGKFQEPRSIWEQIWLATLNSTYSASFRVALDQSERFRSRRPQAGGAGGKGGALSGELSLRTPSPAPPSLSHTDSDPSNPTSPKPARSSTHPALPGASPVNMHLGPGLTSCPSAARLGRRAMRTFES